MPLYTYYCESCKQSTEELMSMKNRPDAITCVHCGGSSKFQISPAQFQVNGANAANRYSGDSNFKWMGVGDDD